VKYTDTFPQGEDSERAREREIEVKFRTGEDR
jgi:hypothetical protein